MTAIPSQPAPVQPPAVALGSRPFNLARQTASRAMGLRFWSLTPRERREHLRFDEAGRLVSLTYPGFWFDVCAVIYLCSILPHVVHLAAEFPDRARELTLELAEAENVCFGSARAAEWTAQFIRLLNEALAKK